MRNFIERLAVEGKLINFSVCPVRDGGGKPPIPLGKILGAGPLGPVP